MNDVLEKVMTFINENTYLLIGICVFLIFVLIGYLIDNSVKSKRVRKDIKNKDQVPENIKNEIIKEAINENKEKIMENSFHNVVREENEEVNSDEVSLEDKNSKIEETLNMELNLDEVPKQDDLNIPLDLDDESISIPFSLDDSPNSNINLDTKLEEKIDDEPLMVDISNNDLKTDNVEDSFVLDITTNENNNDLIVDTPVGVDLTSSIDPDAAIMNLQTDNTKYKNDKKLSEILLNVDKERVNSASKENISLFEDKASNIEVNTNIEKEKVEIEKEYDSSDELDKIMKKLSSMNNDEEDNYTNIF